MTDLPAELMDKLHIEALAEHAARQPYCLGDRCEDCTPDEECCEATCGYCPRVEAHDYCRLMPGSEDDSKYCDQHGEGSLFDRTPGKCQILRNA